MCSSRLCVVVCLCQWVVCWVCAQGCVFVGVYVPATDFVNVVCDS